MADLRKPGPFERVGDRVTPTEGGQLEETRRRFDELDAYVRTLPEGRERATALTQLETAGMWATKATTHVVRDMAPREAT